MSARCALAIAVVLSTSGCLNYAMATDDTSPRTLGLFAAAEVSAAAIVGTFAPIDWKNGKLLPYPVRVAILTAMTVLTDGSIVMLLYSQ